MNNICIIIVTYNASLAVKLTLASLNKAFNSTNYSLFIIDNGSNITEREIIRSSVESYRDRNSINWNFIQLEENLGFSGGNNIGIKFFLENSNFTHVCLLNSDVIVTDNWLDRLVDKNRDIISPVTNKSYSSQCVPVDYYIDIHSSFNLTTNNIFESVYNKINSYSSKCYRAWNGNIVSDDVTFFCVLMTKKLIEKIGSLDEFFFPGGYEDDDFCLRVKKEGIKIYISRDVFIHHWGSASFGKLQKDYFSENSQRNKLYLERKHGITLEDKFLSPFYSYMQDMIFALSGKGERESQEYINKLYVRDLDKLFKTFEKNYKFYRKLSEKMSVDLPSDLKLSLEQITNKGRGPRGFFNRTVKNINYLLKKSSIKRDEIEKIQNDFKIIFDEVSNISNFVFRMHNLMKPFLGDNLNTNINNSSTGLERIFRFFYHGLTFIWNLKGIVFFGGYPYTSREMDGYFQRIRAIDELFPERWRIYVDHENLSSNDSWWDLPTERTLVLRITGHTFRKFLVRFLVLVCVLRCRIIYFHSILRMNDSKFGYFLKLPLIVKVLDVHGVVPEEFRYHNDSFRARFYEFYERLAMKKCDYIIVVSAAMRSHLLNKYGKLIRGKQIVFPIFPQLIPAADHCRPYIENKPVVVYAGGLHKWQQVQKMIDAINATNEFCLHKFYCPNSEIFLAMLPETLRNNPYLVVESKTHRDLLAIYPQCHYGFILREDDVVNHAACPTKMVEYIAMGIIPIVDCADIGDFNSMGLQFVRLRNFLAGNLPDEETRNQMAQVNFTIFARLRKLHLSGAENLLSSLSFLNLRSMNLSSRCKAYVTNFFQKAMFKMRTVRNFWQLVSRNNVLKKILLRFRNRPNITLTDIFGNQVTSPPVPKCNILVQVDNFLIGGLENVVLDLNVILEHSDLKILLLVLGEAGPAVERARESGMNVCVAQFTPAGYAELLRKTSPQLVLSHYSIQGASICKRMNIPVVQVIHNTYMWFSGKQTTDFASAARDTTAFVAVSSFAKAYSIQRLGVLDEKCVVIPNGIDLVKFKKMDFKVERNHLRAKLGLTDDDFVFLNVGAITHQKNHFGAIKAFHTAMQVSDKTKLVFLGPIYEQHLFDEINRYISCHNLESRVIYAGVTSNAQCYYAMADAFVSSAFFEGGQLSLLEAIAANLPIITTEIGFAIHFKGRIGFRVVQPHFDIASYFGPIWDMKSSPESERYLAEAMIKTYKNPIRPDFDRASLDLLDKSNSYKLYVELINHIVQGREIPKDRLINSWITDTTSRIRDLN